MRCKQRDKGAWKFPASMAMRIKFAAQIMKQFKMADFFLVRTASLFTLRTCGAQINWHVISRKALFAPHRFLSNKSPIHFAGESGNRNTFLNGKWHVHKWKWTSIATVPDFCPTTVKIFTHLISGYQLPLKGLSKHPGRVEWTWQSLSVLNYLWRTRLSCSGIVEG
jgi:hypothetical protein